MLAGLSAVSYCLWTLLCLVLHFGTLFPHQFATLFDHHNPKIRGVLIIAEVHVSFRSELALHLLVFKVLVVKATEMLGGFGYNLALLMYYFVDLPNMCVCAYFFWEMLQDRQIVQGAMQSLGLQEQLVNFMSLPWLTRIFLNPIWRPSHIIKYPNICYATHEEVKDAIRATGDPAVQYKLRLDVFTPAAKSAKLRPVLFHVHGGAWVKGTKDILYPYQKLLVTQDDWVVVNIAYRLAPENPYPAHLYDVKRALRWVKQSIHAYGGDKDFIVLAGDSAGGHLSAMAAMTANEAQWQPGFEDVDTSVRGVISLNGALDIQGDDLRRNFFMHRVMNQKSVDQSFLDAHSPQHRILTQGAKDNNLVPYLCFAGQRDALVDVSVGHNFNAAMKSGKMNLLTSLSDTCTLVVLPTSHHIWYILWSPRSFYCSQMIQAWCRQLYRPYSKAQ
ncbi:Alpha/Beta hydrolase protein [Gongronella butleri]|nr:Alpha/Beta hydrolase protein [Gongronella butleri]